MRGFSILAIVLGLSVACVLGAEGESPGWIGKSSDEVVAAYGAPSKVKPSRDGGRILLYRLPGGSFPEALPTKTPPVPFSWYPPQPHREHAYRDGFLETTNLNNAPPLPRFPTGKCKLRFVVDAAGVVGDVRFSKKCFSSVDPAD